MFIFRHQKPHMFILEACTANQMDMNATLIDSLTVIPYYWLRSIKITHLIFLNFFFIMADQMKTCVTPITNVLPHRVVRKLVNELRRSINAAVNGKNSASYRPVSIIKPHHVDVLRKIQALINDTVRRIKCNDFKIPKFETPQGMGKLFNVIPQPSMKPKLLPIDTT